MRNSSKTKIEVKTYKASKEISDEQIDSAKDLSESIALNIEKFINQLHTTTQRFEKNSIFSINLRLQDDKNNVVQTFCADNIDDLYFGSLLMAMETFIDMQQRAGESMGANDFFEKAPSSKKLAVVKEVTSEVLEHITEIEHLVKTAEKTGMK